ncbi:hypothetical protein D854_gp16 [Streptomyces phage R4]|uniref:DUF7417 domain-containing protein n=2 Tax=Arequatrovirus TaxID=1982881 RepID=K4HYB5_9CAUD|nr:hypothetical protein D854_gp16 [Streptomyces phage R4]YP_009591528.1 hypothetical protein FDG59_gp15 [Streptomyces phage phiELB20]AFO10935.1 hypothetical protein ELB20_69 [Streptomyces phage phiELB20]AFU62126.1 hypothetical protein R4_71 [Streptomyces phage R4]
MGRMKDLAIDLMTFEEGQLDPRETLELFSTLIASGMAWTLQGSYGRAAQMMINEGWISPLGIITDDGAEMLEAVA